MKMQVRDNYGSPGEPKEMDWPFLIKGLMDSKCPSSQITTPGLCISIVAIIFGILFACFGYRCLRAVGFISGALVGVGILYLVRPLDFNKIIDLVILIGVAIVSAMIGSTIQVASGLINSFAGAIIAQLIMSICIATLDYKIGPTEVYGAIVFGAVLFLTFTFCCVKCITICSTSVVGSVLYMTAIDYLLHDFATIKWIEKMTRNPQSPTCWGGILLFLLPIVILISILIQTFITAWRFQHKKTIQMRKNCRRPQCVLRPPAGPPMANNFSSANCTDNKKQQRYRYLYQVRTSKGDIISQPYIAALQRRIKSCTFPKKNPLDKKTPIKCKELKNESKREICFNQRTSVDCVERCEKDKNKECGPTTNICDDSDCEEIKIIKICKKK